MLNLVRVGYLALSLIQWWAVVAGIEHLLGTGWFVSGVISLLATFVPFAGSAAAIYGAVTAWDWSFWLAAAVFIGPFVALFGLAMML